MNPKREPALSRGGPAPSGKAVPEEQALSQVVSSPEPVESKSLKSPPPAPRIKIPYPYFHLSVGLILTLTLLAGLIFASRQLSSLSHQTQQARAQLMVVKEKDLSLKKLDQDLQSVDSEALLISQGLPDEEGIVDFVKEFRKISQGLALKAFAFETDQPNLDSANNLFIDFDAELEGNLNDLEKFLSNLIKLPYLIRLRLADFSGIDQDSAILVINARIFVNDPFFLSQP